MSVGKHVMYYIVITVLAVLAVLNMTPTVLMDPIHDVPKGKKFKIVQQAVRKSLIYLTLHLK